MVAARLGESAPKRTLNNLLPPQLITLFTPALNSSVHSFREVISVFTTGVSSCVHSVRVGKTTGPGRETVQFLSGREISFGFCVSQRCREISRWNVGESSRSASKVRVSFCRRQMQTIHCNGIGRGSSLMVTLAFSNQCVAKLKCACRRLVLSHLVSTTRPREAQAASTHCTTKAPLRRFQR